MTYELTKQLKDAGFPKEGFEYDEVVEIKMGESLVSSGDGWRNIPTLEELIEACGDDEDFYLGRIGDEWTAWYKNPSNNVRLGETEGEYEGEGKTPKEAVARLWLARNS